MSKLIGYIILFLNYTLIELINKLKHCYTLFLPFMNREHFRSSGFPGSSAGKESACNAGDPSLIPGMGRSGEGIGYPLQYSWASLVAQMVKNLLAKTTWQDKY